MSEFVDLSGSEIKFVRKTIIRAFPNIQLFSTALRDVDFFDEHVAPPETAVSMNVDYEQAIQNYVLNTIIPVGALHRFLMALSENRRIQVQVQALMKTSEEASEKCFKLFRAATEATPTLPKPFDVRPERQTSGANIVNTSYGGSAEDLVAALDARGLLRRATQQGLEQKTIIGLAQRLNSEVIDFDQGSKELERAVTIALEIIAKGEHGTNYDTFVNDVLAKVAAQTRRGDLDGGAKSIDDGLSELEAQHRRSRVALLEEGIMVDTLRRDATSVARRVEALVATGGATDRPAWSDAFVERHKDFVRDGNAGPNNFSLLVGVEMGRRMQTAAQDAAERAYATDMLAYLLTLLGGRESGTTHLEEAEAICRAKLETTNRACVPLDWARAQCMLGDVLVGLGNWETGTARLEEALTCYRAAVEETARERDLPTWAAVQNSYAAVLLRLDWREANQMKLDEAITAFRAVLREDIRACDPSVWATAQANLGEALLRLYWRGGGSRPGLPEDAITAHRSAQEVWTREDVPLQWAAAQHSIGSVLYIQGAYENDTAKLKDGITAYRVALAEQTRVCVPLAWARTQVNLALALKALGDRENGTTHFEEAIAALREAMEEYPRRELPLDWARCQGYLGQILHVLGVRDGNKKHLKEAVEAFNLALEELTKEGTPSDYEDIRKALKEAEASIFHSQN